MTTPKVIGLDLSLTSTGVAFPWETRCLVPPKGMDGVRRLRWIRDAVVTAAAHPDLAVVEGLAYASLTGKATERAGLWWMVVEALDAAGVPVAVVPPCTLKRYATGKGNSPKDAVLVATALRYTGYEVAGHDQADALVLCAMGMDHLGSPLVRVPSTHRVALTAVSWPVDGAA